MKDKILALSVNRLTAEKTAEILASDEYKISGVVLQHSNGDHCIISDGAVRWISKSEMWWMMHPVIKQYD